MRRRCGKSLFGRTFLVLASVGMFASLLIIASHPAEAQQTWTDWVGSESNDEARQANAFLPSEFWVHEGDSISWIFVPVNEIHTVTFLTPMQVRPSLAGCPGTTATTPSGSSFDGSTCVNSGPMLNKARYTVTFPAAGNFKLVCLVHANMNGTIHVLPPSEALPHEQGFYNQQFVDEAGDLLHDADRAMEEVKDFPSEAHAVLMIGDMTATAGGRQYLSIDRFLPGEIHIQAGQTVEWMNTDATEPHTVTFGPANNAAENVNTAADGALIGTISSTSNNLSSGILQAAPEDRVGLAQSPPGKTHIRITFTEPGVFSYICSLHAGLGMKGTVVVEPKQ